jgi:hypothetical protein
MPQDVGSFPTLRDQGDILFGKRKKKPPGVTQMAKAKLGTGARFAALKGKLVARPGVTDPGALAAAIGRKKYGAKKFAGLAAKGKKTVHAAHGFEGVVSSETHVITGEGNRPEHVRVIPLTGKQAQHVRELERHLDRTVTRYQRSR